jgi:DNA invertase Pin-like site-specific DNA recombinase
MDIRWYDVIMIERHPVAYVRRSFSRRHDPGDISREFQIAEVRRLAGDDTAAMVIKAADWGVSAAREHTERRLDFLDMIEMVKRREVSVIYAYSADRLARSVQWSARLIDACEDAGTTIVTGEGRYAPNDDAAKMMFGFLALQNESALRQMKKKTRASFEVRKARGDHLGPAPYGSRVIDGKVVDNPNERLEEVLAAYRRAGTIQGAARALNQSSVGTRSGKPWRASTLRGILERASVLPRRIPRGRTPGRSYLLAKLLRCPCGATMTGRMNTKGRRGFAYECKRAGSVADHGAYSISEARLVPYIRAEAARLLTPDTVLLGPADVEERRSALLEARERVTETYLTTRSKMTREVRDAKWGEIDLELDSLDVVASAEAIPSIDWKQPPAVVNAVLRALWERVDLGSDLLPGRFVWRVPEWRAAEALSA